MSSKGSELSPNKGPMSSGQYSSTSARQPGSHKRTHAGKMSAAAQLTSQHANEELGGPTGRY